MRKIIADSSANLLSLSGAAFQSIPMVIHAGERDFLDNAQLDTGDMMDYLSTFKGRSGTACPGPDGWMNAFAGADEIFVVTITSGLSGTYGSAMAAKDLYEQVHPKVKIHVFDSLSTGPEMQLPIEKLASLLDTDLSFEEIRDAGEAYLRSTRMFFSLQSLHNLAQNGRVNKLVAGAIGILNIRILATASPEGTIAPVEKCRGEKKAQNAMVAKMLEAGYKGGKVRIHHAENPETAQAVKAALLEKFPAADIEIGTCRGLCSYYAERGGVLTAFETA